MIISLAAPFTAGFALVLLLWPKHSHDKYHLMLQGSLAAGLGLGVFSVLLFIFLLVAGSAGGFPFLSLIILAISSALLYYSFKKTDRQDAVCTDSSFVDAGVYKKISIVFYVLTLSVVVIFIAHSLNYPNGGWDAWAIWNVRARYIYRGGEDWLTAFNPFLAHSDYPLLLPLSVANGWIAAGNETIVVPAVIAFVFTFSTILLAFSSLALLRSKDQGYIAGLILLGSLLYIRIGAYQLADVPLGFFFLATVVLLAFYDRTSERRLLFLAGVMAGFAAWTKNEGLLFIVALIISRSLVALRQPDKKQPVKEIFPLLSGALIVLAVILFFKTAIAPANDLFAYQGTTETLSRLTDLSRYHQILMAYASQGWVLTGGLISLPVFGVYFALMGRSPRGCCEASIKTAVITIILLFIGYFFVYITTPHPLAWHLRTSLDRLLVQIWPMFIFWFFMVVRTPGELLSGAGTVRNS